jgi:hypothetical protein
MATALAGARPLGAGEGVHLRGQPLAARLALVRRHGRRGGAHDGHVRGAGARAGAGAGGGAAAVDASRDGQRRAALLLAPGGVGALRRGRRRRATRGTVPGGRVFTVT